MLKSMKRPIRATVGHRWYWWRGEPRRARSVEIPGVGVLVESGGVNWRLMAPSSVTKSRGELLARRHGMSAGWYLDGTQEPFECFYNVDSVGEIAVMGDNGHLIWRGDAANIRKTRAEAYRDWVRRLKAAAKKSANDAQRELKMAMRKSASKVGRRRAA